MNLLRYWLRCYGFSTPSSARLQQVFEDMVLEEAKGTAVISWTGTEVRCYRDWLYLSAPLKKQAFAALSWDGKQPIALDTGYLYPVSSIGQGIKMEFWEQRPLSVRTRMGGERVKLPGKHCHQKLKKLFQEHAVPPWQRDRIPLICVGDELAAVVGFWYCEPYAARENEPGIALEIRHSGN